MRTLPSLLALSLLSLTCWGCSGSSSSGSSSSSSSSAAGVTSSSTGSGVTTVGPLHRKALEFERSMRAQHMPLGQVQNVKVVGGQVQKLGNAPSRQLWTGFYAASQAMRYRATQEADALGSMEDACRALHDLAEVTGIPGIIARGYDDAAIETNGFPASGRFAGFNYNKGGPSRDQYTGWFYGVGQCFPHIQDPALRQALQADVSAVCDRLMANDLELSAPWGPTGQVEEFFNLNPDYFYQNQINAHTWATVDDFPFNLITRSVPYDPVLASAIQQASIPPIRAGEALRAVFMFTVGYEVTGDPRYLTYKNQLLHQKGFADAIDNYSTIMDDLLHGRNLQVAEDALKQLLRTMGDILQAYLVAKGQSVIITQVLVPLLAGPISDWLADMAVDLIAWVHDPNNQGKLQRLVSRAQLLVLVLNLVGQQGLANQIGGFLQTYAANLSHQGLIDFSNTVRSYLGVNLSVMPLAMLVNLETDPAVVALYQRTLERQWGYMSEDHNAMVNLVHAARGQFAPNDLPHSLESLRRFPTDLSMREFDHTNDPGVVVSPWPDRFGKVGGHSLVPFYFDVDERAPNIFSWRSHPRDLTSGSNDPDLKVAPLGYLLPYWMARDEGFVGPAD